MIEEPNTAEAGTIYEDRDVMEGPEQARVVDVAAQL